MQHADIPPILSAAVDLHPSARRHTTGPLAGRGEEAELA